MWSAIGKLFFKIFASVGAIFMARRSGAKAQQLKDAEKTIVSVRKRDATKAKVKRGGATAARKRMRKRNK